MSCLGGSTQGKFLNSAVRRCMKSRRWLLGELRIGAGSACAWNIVAPLEVRGRGRIDEDHYARRCALPPLARHPR